MRLSFFFFCDYKYSLLDFPWGLTCQYFLLKEKEKEKKSKTCSSFMIFKYINWCRLGCFSLCNYSLLEIEINSSSHRVLSHDLAASGYA